LYLKNNRNNNMDLKEKIIKLKEEKNAVILVHNYQRPEIHDVADFIGDSLGLSREATKTDADIIVFCGVDFMAETAKILNPEKRVIVPSIRALCPMAKQITSEQIMEAKSKYPEAKVVLYVNTHAKEKTLADCVCTSANADKIVNAMDSDTVIFGPDDNLGYYVRKRTDKKVVSVPRDGYCYTHRNLSGADLLKAKSKHPNAQVVVHPECIPEVQEAADHIASTEGMIRFCRESGNKEFIVGTEIGLINRLRKEIPEKTFFPLSPVAICGPQKENTLEGVLMCLEKENPEIKLPADVLEKAKKPIERMLELS